MQKNKCNELEFDDAYMLEYVSRVVVKEEYIKSIRKVALLEAAERASHNFGDVISADSLKRMAEE